MFTVVQWGQSLCQAPSGENGSCFRNADECNLRRGIPSGPCAEGHGICCVCKSVTFFIIEKLIKPNRYQWAMPYLVMSTCGEIARYNGTYFVNPNHPDPYEETGSCQLTINKISSDICQIRYEAFTTV